MAGKQLFDATVASLYETVLVAGAWPTALANVAALFRAPTAAMFHFDCRTRTASQMLGHGHDPSVTRIYQEHYYKLDPGQVLGMSAAVGEWLADEPLLDVRSPVQQEYARDFALPSGIGRVAGWKVAGDADRFVYLGLHRPPGSDRFGEEGLRIHGALQPHLLRVTQLKARIDALAAEAALMRSCLDRVQAGVAVVDKSRRVHLINAAGVRLFGQGDALGIRHQRLMSKRADVDESLGRLIGAACTLPATGGALRVTRASPAAALLVMVVPVPSSHDLAALMPEPLALVVVADPEAGVDLAGVYRTLFSLTASEAALMQALARGMSTAQWTAQRGISIATARTQLRSLFEKTGADSQARLVGLAKSIPPFA